jgi:hypothetical protein
MDIMPLDCPAPALVAALASAAAAAATPRWRNSDGSEVVATISIDYTNNDLYVAEGTEGVREKAMTVCDSVIL